jgi:hypothetical protein
MFPRKPQIHQVNPEAAIAGGEIQMRIHELGKRAAIRGVIQEGGVVFREMHTRRSATGRPPERLRGNREELPRHAKRDQPCKPNPDFFQWNPVKPVNLLPDINRVI